MKMTMFSTYTADEVLEIARECAGFAACNGDAPELITPEAMWQGWHDKEGLNVPPMPQAWAILYRHALTTQEVK